METLHYVFIKDGKIEIKDASKLWGQGLKETQEQIRKENNDLKIRIIGIGIAGENLVKFANLITDLHDAAGRNGLGTVMGSKNLKAVAVRGTAGIQINFPRPYGRGSHCLNFVALHLEEEGKMQGELHPTTLRSGILVR
ncbi:MAG: aldehyde ferredoxin oxidoreductase N-terminal domain-containing protein [Dehalococcoidia bacterium]|nr:aldehyde ferredoxin oxidoreductase N-terminal domain-containing protein [Dehalococcoidia bacterium]